MADIYRRFSISRIDGYEILGKLEQMNYVGNVFKCRSNEGIDYLIKYGEKEQLSYEYSIELSCQGLLKQVSFHDKNDPAAIIYEYPKDGKTLKDVVDSYNGQIPEDEIKKWCFDILLTLRDLHDNRLYHNNLCLENAFLCSIVMEDHVKITGMKEYTKLSPAESKLFTTDFSFNPGIPPEQIDGLPRIRSSDVWSLGIMILYMMNKQYPFGTSKEELIVKLTNYRSKGAFPQINFKYSQELIDIVRSMLIYDSERRPNPHMLLENTYFHDLINPSFQPMDKVIIKGDAPRYRIFAGTNMYKFGAISFIEDDKVVIAFPYESPDAAEVNLKTSHLELCTETKKDEGIIPLTVGCKVIRGPDWDDEAHGNNDESGAGTVMTIIPCNGENRNFIAVAVKWPFTGRVVRYFYGQVNLLSKTEVLPAYPPILPGMIIHKGPHSKIDFTDGFIMNVFPSKDEAEVRINDKTEKLLYGKNDVFEFIIDSMYYENCLCNSVEEYLATLESNPDDFLLGETTDSSYDIQFQILDEYRKKRDAHQAIISEGMFVHIPNRKDILFARVKDITNNTITAIGSTGQGSVYLENINILGLVQCSYGTHTDPPIFLQDKVFTKSGGQGGTVVYIGNDNTSQKSGKKNLLSWKYVVIQGDAPTNQLQCFRYHELTVSKRK